MKNTTKSHVFFIPTFFLPIKYVNTFTSSINGIWFMHTLTDFNQDFAKMSMAMLLLQIPWIFNGMQAHLSNSHNICYQNDWNVFVYLVSLHPYYIPLIDFNTKSIEQFTRNPQVERLRSWFFVVIFVFMFVNGYHWALCHC